MSKRHVVSNGSKTTEVMTSEGWLVKSVEPAGTLARGIYYPKC